MSPTDAVTLVVWRSGDALLAVALAAVEAIAPVGADGQALARAGALELRSPPGLPPPAGARQAVVVRRGAGDARQRVALPADHVEGVLEARGPVREPPPWLAGLGAGHLAGLILLEDGRVAATLDPDSLFGLP
jgi:hypothetical protein